MDVLEEVGADMKVEKIILAEEMKLQNPEILRQIERNFLQSMKRVSNQRYKFVLHSDLQKNDKNMQGSYSNRRDNALCKYYFTVGLYFLREENTV